MGIPSSIAVSVLAGLALVWGSHRIESTFLADFLRTNLLLLLPALMAINVTTASVVMTKLRELGDKHRASFANTIRSIKVSFYEQTALMVITAGLQMADGSKLLSGAGDDLRFILEAMICACFVYALLVLLDTANSIFLIMEFEDEKGKK